MTKGTITRLIADRGYGFIRTEKNEDVFLHRNELVGITYGSLREGQQGLSRGIYYLARLIKWNTSA